jgi:LPS export ABC transporter protein LptC|tara:strand:- start:508 stop:1095 length:588 start_codon:yes stop_codon:yes gene_type:complete
MNKKKLLQIFIFFLIILISVWFYLEYFNKSPKNLEKNTINQKVEVVENNTANYIEDIDYTSLDSGGNKYQITAKRAKIDLLDQDIMFLENSIAYMYTQDYTDMVKITSDFGKYNSENYDTIFSTNVIITYSDYKITGEYLEFSFLNNLGVISGNVIYSGDSINLSADRVEINLITRDTKIFMDNKTKKVLINEKK